MWQFREKLRKERGGREKTGGEDGESYKQMSLRDLKLDTKDDEGGASEAQMSGGRERGKKAKRKRKKAIRERPKQQYKSRKREKCARACTQTRFQKGARERKQLITEW